MKNESEVPRSGAERAAFQKNSNRFFFLKIPATRKKYIFFAPMQYLLEEEEAGKARCSCQVCYCALAPASLAERTGGEVLHREGTEEEAQLVHIVYKYRRLYNSRNSSSRLFSYQAFFLHRLLFYASLNKRSEYESS